MSKADQNKDKNHSGDRDAAYHGNPVGYNQPYVYGYPPPGYAEEDEIDLADLAKRFWSDRILIAKIVGVFVLIGLFVALFSSVEYQTDAVLLPEIQSSQSQAENLLDQYGGLLGIGGGGGQIGPQSVIPPQLYPRIVESVPYQAKLMSTPVTFSTYDTTATAHQFFREIYNPSLLTYLKAYTIGLPGMIIGALKGSPDAQQEIDFSITDRDSVLDLSEAQWITIETLRERVNIQTDQETGVVTLTTEMPDPRAAAELGKAAMGILKEYVREYRTRNAVKDLEFIQSQVNNAEQDFEVVQQKLADFRDSNIDLTSARARTQEQELQSEYDLAFNTYNSLRQQLEQAKLKVQEQTPVFSVLQPVTVPLEKSQPKRLLILIISLILGLIVALGWSLVRVWGQDFIQEVQAEDESSDKEYEPIKQSDTVQDDK